MMGVPSPILLNSYPHAVEHLLHLNQNETFEEIKWRPHPGNKHWLYSKAELIRSNWNKDDFDC